MWDRIDNIRRSQDEIEGSGVESREILHIHVSHIDLGVGLTRRCQHPFGIVDSEILPGEWCEKCRRSPSADPDIQDSLIEEAIPISQQGNCLGATEVYGAIGSLHTRQVIDTVVQQVVFTWI